MLKLTFAILFLTPSITLGATIYIDGRLGANCTSSNYSITNRSCTGKDGNAYNNIQSALTASAASDTISVRAGSYTSNAANGAGIFPKASQTWQPYSNEAVTIDGGTHTRIFQIESVNNVTIRGFTLTGGQQNAVWVGSTTGSKIINNQISGWGTISAEYNHGINVSNSSINVEVSGNTIHDPANLRLFIAGIGTGGSGTTNLLIDGNTVYGMDMGIWSDVNTCDPNAGSTPCTVRNNIVHDIVTYCYHMEIGSTWHMYQNIGYNCGGMAVFVRPGANKMTGLKIQNNTFWNVGNINIGGSAGGITIQQDATGSISNSNIDNNIIASSINIGYLLSVGASSAAQATNTFRNNLIYAANNNFGVCWNKGPIGSGTSCGTGTGYADSSAGISSWQAAAPTATNNLSGNPLLANTTSADFRLCTGTGQAVAGCTGASPAIDAGVNIVLPYNGSAPDIGAIESGATVQALSAPTVLTVTSP